MLLYLCIFPFPSPHPITASFFILLGQSDSNAFSAQATQSSRRRRSPPGLSDAEVTQKLSDGSPSSVVRVRLERNEHGRSIQFEAIIKRRPAAQVQHQAPLAGTAVLPASAAVSLHQLGRNGADSVVKHDMPLASKATAEGSSSIKAVPSSGGGLKITTAPLSVATPQVPAVATTDASSHRGGAAGSLHVPATQASPGASAVWEESLDYKATYRVICTGPL